MFRSLKRMIALSALMLSVAACGTSVTQAPTGVSGQSKARVLAFAGKQGPILLQVSGEPFREGKAETAALSARILSPLYPEVPQGFTVNPQQAGAPQFRFRLAFDPIASTSPGRVCSAGTSNPLSYDRRPSRQALFMVFCRADVPIAAVKALSDRMNTLQDPKFRDLLMQSARQMFAADPNDTGSLGILEFDPKPRIKLNPLEGIF
ncbi:hypothetical protein NUH88_19505 [Nisaea acidiphila]|uniref:Lipoprotein n=1 Tax=Nisaea acidiphila TaxID=1862145 RepID=A0A9J7AVW9_9PROT|nr:hypothetical protein [Nisaea acidiphila]UUX49573.1 hypothetical protein NUH88_19505 [Nisaea acidiphila]